MEFYCWRLRRIYFSSNYSQCRKADFPLECILYTVYSIYCKYIFHPGCKLIHFIHFPAFLRSLGLANDHMFDEDDEYVEVPLVVSLSRMRKVPLGFPLDRSCLSASFRPSLPKYQLEREAGNNNYTSVLFPPFILFLYATF